MLLPLLLPLLLLLLANGQRSVAALAALAAPLLLLLLLRRLADLLAALLQVALPPLLGVRGRLLLLLRLARLAQALRMVCEAGRGRGQASGTGPAHHQSHFEHNQVLLSQPTEGPCPLSWPTPPPSRTSSFFCSRSRSSSLLGGLPLPMAS